MVSSQITLGAVAIATAAAVSIWPAEVACVLLLFAPVIWAGGAANIHAQGPMVPNIAAVISGVATLMYARFLFRRQSIPVLRVLRTASIAYCVAIVPSVFISHFFMRSLEGYVRLISPIVFMFVLLHTSHPRWVHTFQFKAFTGAAIALLGTVIAATYAGQASFVMGGFDRLRAFNLSPQNLAFYSVAATGVLVCAISLRKHRIVYALIMLALAVCVYLTGYRTAWIGMAVLVAIVTLIVVRSRLARVAAIAAVIVIVAESSTIVQSLARYVQVSDRGVSLSTANAITSGRIATDMSALDRYANGSPLEWLFGIGVYSSEQVSVESGSLGSGVHSDLLATLIECGIVGLLAYLFLLLTIGWILLRLGRSVPQLHPIRLLVNMAWAMYLAFIVMGISGALYTNVFVGWYYYGFIGFVLAHAKALWPPAQVLARESGARLRQAYRVPSTPYYAPRPY